MELDFDSGIFSRTLKLLGPPAPSCPKCQEALDRIEVERYPDTLEWDREVGTYDFSRVVPAAVYKCPHCKQKIGGRYGTGEKWGFDPAQANVIGQKRLEEEKEMLKKLETNLPRGKSRFSPT
jgi:hypothetical protein